MLPRKQFGWISEPLHGPGAVVRRIAPRFPARAGNRYRAARAALVGEFASKLADAFRHATGAELEALLARLSAVVRMAANPFSPLG